MRAFYFSLLILTLVNLINCQSDKKLQDLRNEMKNKNCDAYIIPSEDAHQSEYVAKYDERRAWITGFTGSAGTAVVTADSAGLWTDSRYYIQAEQQLDKNNWKLMRASDKETPSIESYLNTKLTKNQTVCENGLFVSINGWKNREKKLTDFGLQFIDSVDLVDPIWPTTDRDAKPNNKIFHHDIYYTGKTLMEKIKSVREKMNETGADIFVVSALDETAWLFNLRGSDLPNNPMFFSYAIISHNDNDLRLYVNSSRNNFTLVEEKHLKGITIKDYESIIDDLTDLSKSTLKIWISPSSSYTMYNAISNKDNLIDNIESPIKNLKAIKNKVELERTRECQIRDSAARVRHMYWLKTELDAGRVVTEITSADKLRDIEKEDDRYQSLSFDSISAVGKNGAIVHYSTNEGDNSTLTKDKVYLLDAGAQYLDCTTDITRTHHFGTPTQKEIFAYTRVLQGSIDLSNIYFPEGTQGAVLDVEARASLWRAGLDYGHSTGHGIGFFLGVHEDPPFISYNSRRTGIPLTIGMITSDEPGYYEEGNFGIRLETDIVVVEAKTEYSYKTRKTLKFDSLTLVPFDRKLIDICALTRLQLEWLNDYNKLIIEKVKPLLKDQNVIAYLLEETKPFSLYYKRDSDGVCRDLLASNAGMIFKSSNLILTALSLAVCLKKLFY